MSLSREIDVKLRQSHTKTLKIRGNASNERNFQLLAIERMAT